MSDIKFFESGADDPQTPISKSAIAGDLMYTWGYGEVLRVGHEATDMRKVFEHIKGLLEAQGLTFADVVKTTVLLTRVDQWDVYTEVYKEYFKPPYPCRTTIPVVTEQAILEMDIVAYKKGLGDSG